MELTILIPVRNEGFNLKIMLKILQAVVEEEHEVLVVVDTADDESIPVVEKMQKNYPNLRLIRNELGRGVVFAIRAGVEAARGELVLIFAADEVGPILAYEEMLWLMRDGCDFVAFTRYAYGGRRLGGALIGGLLSRVANFLFHHLCGSPFTDATSGIKLFRKKDFARLDLKCRPVGWAVSFEMAIKAQHIGLRLGEVPVVSIDRLYGGASTFRLGPWMKEYARWFFWGLRHRRQAMANREIKVRTPTYH